MPREWNRGIRRKWIEENLQKAIAAGRNGMSKNLASKRFLVPRGTLRDYLGKNLTSKCSMGHKSILTKEQGQELCSRIIPLAEIEYPLISKVLRRCVFNFCDANSIYHPFNEEKN
ncbi:unnamed protein product [Acanthoscelides obtectus]|uniref:HTH psq-type domain-containing protein n=1 Tax=Acanthoscelides obtectus TaxID=200917 RepID=A0A9P0LP78_ACAOB|nr:unnamed protein product [Acanthoscelides obtectus]CAK1660301.1 hypothetical protein AOBTE_LOCUS21974 [Acanthoscelides obtectus]